MRRNLLLLAGVLTMTSCAESLTPEGEIVDRRVEISRAVDRIEIGDGMTLVLTKDIPAGEALIRTHGNVQPYIGVETDADRVAFTIQAKRFKNLDVTVEASLDQYRDFAASGGARISTDGALALTEAVFTVSGGSQAAVSGTCASARIDCSGGSVFQGYGLSTQSAEVVNSGGSRLEINVTQSLTGENSGGSVLRYRGEPSILNVNNSGGSQTIREE